MPGPQKFRTTGWKLVDTTFAAHVQSPPGTDIKIATTSSIAYTVTEMVGSQQNVVTDSGSVPPVVASTVYDTLQTPSIDPSWVQDNTGYNFKFTVPGASFPDAGDYVVRFMFTPTGGGSAFPVEFFHHANSVT